MKINLSKKAQKNLDKLDNSIAKVITDYLSEIEALEDPRSRGKTLTGNLAGLWRYRVSDYRVSDYRVLCRIEDKVLTIYAIRISHRKDVYDD